VHVPKPATVDHQPAPIDHSPVLNKAGVQSDSAPVGTTLAQTVTVDGHIYFGTTATPAADVDVSFCQVGGDSLGGQCYSGYTNSSGEIAQDAESPNSPVYLPANVDYSMRVQNFSNPHFVISLYVPTEPGVICAQQADDGCTFSAGTSAVTGVDAVLTPAATLSGTVTADGGAAVSGIMVYLDQWNEATEQFTEYEQLPSGTDGTYTFGGISAGDYAVEYVDSTGKYAYQDFDDESEFYEPDLITLATNDNATGVDAQLHLVGKISGTIATPGGTSADLAAGAVTAELQVFDASSESWVDTGFYTNAATNGTYSLNDLAPDTYRVRVDYYGAVKAATFVGPPIVVTAGHTTTYNTPINVTGPNSTDSSIDSISGSASGVTAAGWAVYPADDSTTVGVALNIGPNWYSLTANQANAEVQSAEEVNGISVSPYHGFDGTTLIAPGTYSACIWVTEPTGSAVNIGCKTVTVPLPRKAVANLDSAAGSSVSNTGDIRVTGYAVWPDSLGSTVPIAVEVGSSWYGFSAQDVSTEGAIAVPGAGAHHGFDDTVQFGYKPGSTYQVCVWISEQAGGATNLGCQAVTIPVAGATIAKLDSATGSNTGITVSGYALYPNNDAASVGVAVNVAGGWYGLTANQHSEEGASDVPGASVNHGFVGTIPIAPGSHSACVWVTEPSGPAVNIGCHTVTVPAPTPAVVHSDSVTGGLGSVSVAGWDVFPDTLSTQVGLALNIGAAWYGFTANLTNPEVTVAYPPASADHGYADTVALAPGTYNVCVWTTEPSGPAVNTGCHSVVVTAPHPAVVHSDSVTGGLGSVSVAGWDVFPDSLSTHVGMALNIGAAWYGFTANVTNSEVTVAYPTAASDHGYADTIALAPGTYNVCVWTTEPAGAAVNAGCSSVIVTAPHPAATNIDSVTGGVGTVSVAGWDVFPDSLSTQVGMAINIGANWYSVTANTPNSESASAYPASTVDHGFASSLALAPGTYNVCLWTVEPSGPAMNIGCRNATVTPPPPAVTSFDTAVAVSGGIEVTGYSVFPNALGTSVGVAAQVGTTWYGYSANVANTAVQTLYGSADHGFGGFIPASHGTYNICMWTTEPSGPAVNFGCESVVVP
jgi:hypothetical protein